MAESKPFVIHEQECEFERWADLVRGWVRWRTLLSADGTPTDSIVMGIMEIEPGEENQLRLHRHAQPEVYYILSGFGRVRLCDTNYQVRAGSVIFVPSNTEHDVRNTGSKLLRILYVFPVDSYDEVHYEFPGPRGDAL